MKKRNIDDVFCPVPFFKINNKINGRYTLCCFAHPRKTGANIRDELPFDHFLSDDMNQVRDEFAQNIVSDETKRTCEKCVLGPGGPKDVYKNTIKSDESVVKAVEEYEIGTKKYVPKDRIMEVQIRMFGNKCNLSCVMCKPKNSSKRTKDLTEIQKELGKENEWFDLHKKAQEMTEVRFEEVLNDIFIHADVIKEVTLIGGEPILLKNHKRMVDTIIDTGQAGDIILQYVTNLTVLDEEVIDLEGMSDKFKRLKFNISIDSIGERNDYVRYGSKWDKMIENLDKIHDLIERKRNVAASISPTFNSLNCYDIPEIFNFFENKYPLFNIRNDSMCFVYEPEMLNVKHLSNEKRKDVSRFYEGLLQGANDPERPRYRSYQRIIDFLNQPGWYINRYDELIEYLDALDRKRGTNFRNLWRHLW